MSALLEHVARQRAWAEARRDEEHRVLERMLNDMHREGRVTFVRKLVDGAFVVGGFGAMLGLPDDVQERLEERYPVRHAAEEIEWGEPQWIEGDHEALKYRGHVLKRGKMWFQDGDPNKTGEFLRYVYTGFSHAVLPATSDIDNCHELKLVIDCYNATLAARAPAQHAQWKANHAIVTHYRNGEANIGMHSDKTKSLGRNSLITVVKTGRAARPFRITNVDESTELFNEVVNPGDAIIMTTHANERLKHGVPVVSGCEVGPSGSVVFRTVIDRVGLYDLGRRIRTLRAAQAKRAEKKEQKKRKREEDQEEEEKNVAQ